MLVEHFGFLCTSVQLAKPCAYRRGAETDLSTPVCSQVSAHYVRPNISRNARDRTAAFFKVLSVLAEIFVFSYIGELSTPHLCALSRDVLILRVRTTSICGPILDQFR